LLFPLSFTQVSNRKITLRYFLNRLIDRQMLSQRLVW
jgi:hypothetical protein